MRRIAAYITLAIWIISTAAPLQAQRSRSSPANVYVDKNGIMRWSNNHAEITGFGVNYTVPFAHAYRAAQQLNIPIEKAIDNDVYHFSRLGFDAYRVHVWDTEISDTLGNLLENEHLKLFDYLLFKMKERRIRILLTPIAYWGNGYPEPDERTPGFARKYGKGACLTHPEAIKAQENYLFQFLNHVNGYTGIAYKDDPDLIAFEISNEPHHGGSPDSVTIFIKRMMAAMRKTGCKKPVFYNISHSIHLVNAYFDAGIQGGTFQWYPTGLVSRQEVGGNLLPNVDQYTIPFAGQSPFKKIAKIVYEFDAADVGRSYIYPAMARSFREAGIQWATHFAYDPTYMAYANTEYSTHFMNLAYAPQKALSLKIASAVFHTIPLYKNYGAYPANTAFDVFHVSYEKDLAEMISDTCFIYTNNTTSSPARNNNLKEIAGAGNSPFVRYEGTGAYFLDRLEDGVWRLEVMPDAIWVNDPFGRNSLKKEVAIINWRSWPLKINLPDLGNDFTITALNDGNTWKGTCNHQTFNITPGAYLLTRKGASSHFHANSKWKNITLKEFSAPPATIKSTYVLHQPPDEITAGKPYTVETVIASPEIPETVELHILAGFRPEVIKMERQNGYTYSAVIPEKFLREGILRYHIAVKEKGKFKTYPSGLETHPLDWDFYDTHAYQLRIVPDTAPLYLFNADADAEGMSRQWMSRSSIVPTGEPARAEMIANIEKLPPTDPHNKDGKTTYDYSMRFYFGKKIAGRKVELAAKKQLILRGRTLNHQTCLLQLALITKDGTAFGGIINVQPQAGDYSISLADMKKVKLVSLPRPYPTFLPYYFENSHATGFDWSTVEVLQISVGPGMPEKELLQKHVVAIESVRLE